MFSLLLPNILFLGILVFVVAVLVYALQQYSRLLDKYQHLNTQTIFSNYENLVLSEVGSNIGYLLNEVKIAEIITGTIPNFLPSSVASYLVLAPEKLVFKANLRESVSTDFIAEIKKQMLSALLPVTSEAVLKLPLDETFTGNRFSQANKNRVRSATNLLLTIKEKTVGVINVSSTATNVYTAAEKEALEKIVSKACAEVSRFNVTLELEKGKMAVMVQSLADGVLMVDTAFKVATINPAARDFLRLPATADLTFSDVSDALRSRFSLQDKVAEVLKTGQESNLGEFPLNDRFLQATISPVSSEQGLLGATLIFRDLTEQKTLARLRDDFTAMLVHELRTPLSVMYATGDLLLKRITQLPPEKVNYLLGQVRESSNYLLGLVNNLLDAAKIESGKFEVHAESGDLGALLNEEKGYFESMAAPKGLTLAVEAPSDFPPVLFEKARVVQILTNLISNALKFTEKGGVILSLVLSETNKKMAVVGVSDSGVGIPKDAVDKLFNKFEQLRNPVDPKSKGTGLGLVIAKGIVEAHGGRIWVESMENKGTTFYFTLPLAV